MGVKAWVEASRVRRVRESCISIRIRKLFKGRFISWGRVMYKVCVLRWRLYSCGCC